MNENQSCENRTRQPVVLVDSEAPDIQEHADGTAAGRYVRNAVIAEFGPGEAHVVTTTAEHDYICVNVARFFPTEADARRMLSAIRSVLPKWRRVSVSVLRDQNRMGALCYAHNLISTGVSPLPQHPVVKFVPPNPWLLVSWNLACQKALCSSDPVLSGRYQAEAAQENERRGQQEFAARKS